MCVFQIIVSQFKSKNNHLMLEDDRCYKYAYNLHFFFILIFFFVIVTFVIILIKLIRQTGIRLQLQFLFLSIYGRRRKMFSNTKKMDVPLRHSFDSGKANIFSGNVKWNEEHKLYSSLNLFEWLKKWNFGRNQF